MSIKNGESRREAPNKKKKFVLVEESVEMDRPAAPLRNFMKSTKSLHTALHHTQNRDRSKVFKEENN